MTNKKMPLLFIGHGSPMNALANNDYTSALNKITKTFETPKAILVISAHWMTEGTFITSMSAPKTIHDFGGFPKELFAISYPAPGNPELARSIIEAFDTPTIQADNNKWGLDHGTWSVLRHMYPEAKIPVLQLSMDMTKPPQFHFDLGKQLNFLREQGVLILGSGNIVHNLRKIEWEEKAKSYDWAIEYDLWVKEKTLAGDFKALINDYTKSPIGQLSNPTPDHYYPLLYILGAVEANDQLSFFYEGMQNASISMRSFIWN